MGSSIGKHQTYTYGFPPRKVPTSDGNHYSKDFWASDPPAGPAAAKSSKSEYWIGNNDQQYRQDVFNRKSDNFYPSASTYHNQSTFQSPFTFESKAQKPKPATLQESTSCNRSASISAPRCPPPYTSGSTMQQNSLRPGPSKYIPGIASM
uniref:RBPJ-interacting and tubulin-associated protein n=1 Tax=Panagrellus redivivus TaxID=6233 RepID=A0A7E4ZZ84_PANRE